MSVFVKAKYVENDDGVPIGIWYPEWYQPIDHQYFFDHGWLKMEGQELSRKYYKDLFSVIGETYGKGDGKTTFNLPDFENKFSGNHFYVRGYSTI